MEIPVISRVNDFEASVNSLSSNPPSLISRLLSIFQLERFSPPNRLLLWKWGPLLLALIYAFGSVARRVRILMSQRHHIKQPDSLQPLLRDDGSDAVSVVGDGDDGREDDRDGGQNDAACSHCPPEDERWYGTNYSYPAGFDEDFRVAGSYNSSDRSGQKRKFKIRRRRSLTGDNLFSLAELVNGKSVVKLWDGLGLDLDIGNSCSFSSTSSPADSIPILDLERDVRIGSILGDVPAVSMSSPAVLFTSSSGGGTLGLSSWDVRLRRRQPAVKVEWRWPAATGRPLAGAMVGVNAGGVDKVYVRGDLVETVGDMRQPKSPLDNVTEFDGETWWDADAR